LHNSKYAELFDETLMISQSKTKDEEGQD